MIADFSSASCQRLINDLEIALIKKLANFPHVIKGAAGLAEPHRIVFYLLDLAAAFHQLWTAGKESGDLRFIQKDDENLTKARLALVDSFCQVMGIAGSIMGIAWRNELR